MNAISRHWPLTTAIIIRLCARHITRYCLMVKDSLVKLKASKGVLANADTLEACREELKGNSERGTKGVKSLPLKNDVNLKDLISEGFPALLKKKGN